MKINNLAPDEQKQLTELLKKMQKSADVTPNNADDNNEPLEV